MYERFELLCGAAGAALLVGAPPAVAGLTDVRPAANGEVGHEQILERLYGVDFSASGADYIGGDVTVRRVDDGADARIRFDTPRRFGLVAAFTGWQWDYSLQDSSGRRVGSGSQTSSGFDVGGGFDVPAGAGPFELVLDHASGRQYRSTDSLDQMVTYTVSGIEDGGEATLFFWEDWSRREGSDMDFNDLVFSATGALGGAAAVADASGAVSIPLPPAALPGAIGLVGGVLAVRRYRRRA